MAAVRLKLPPFWTKNAKVWFAQVEAQFQLQHITSQITKYLHVVSALPAEVADELEDILAATPTANQYDHLKAAILARKTASERSRLQSLLNMEELGDQRPSQLLRRMRQLLGDCTHRCSGSSFCSAFPETWSLCLQRPRTCPWSAWLS
ncbi:unnamed protein product [Ixodes hexagonus]